MRLKDILNKPSYLTIEPMKQHWTEIREEVAEKEGYLNMLNKIFDEKRFKGNFALETNNIEVIAAYNKMIDGFEKKEMPEYTFSDVVHLFEMFVHSHTITNGFNFKKMPKGERSDAIINFLKRHSKNTGK